MWQSLTDATAVFRRPQLVVIASAPGVGKSALALNLAVRSGSSCIYFSADSGPGTQLVRTVSILTGRETGVVQKAMESGYPFTEELRPVRNIWWEFDAGPSLDLIDRSVTAHGYLGAYPDMTIIDNLMNVDAEGESEAKAHKDTLLFGLELARSRNMCVIVLAHLIGEYEDGITPPPLSALMNKIGKIPEMVLTLYNLENPLGGSELGVAIVKNRDGIADAAARYGVSLRKDLSRMTIEDLNNGGLIAA
ncbi:DnaB-like helicase C-terminal domain-containing protein [Actinomadura sp. KC216]|uniref:DnaB-like helicase C-terminal domain-containing protein n=1 Tax=Actinomadura sp. KC216 TaxID=2530370 RepID=UPI0014049A5B|nr:DnaB-like helicase C-terminal domain-containing protein [Actinomadura sp. KC216]